MARMWLRETISFVLPLSLEINEAMLTYIAVFNELNLALQKHKNIKTLLVIMPLSLHKIIIHCA